MLTPADQLHREQFRQFCISQAEPGFRKAMLLLYDHWNDYNSAFFADTLTAPYILIAPTVSASAYGDTRPISDFGGRMQITIKRTLIDGTHAHFEAGTHDTIGQQRFVLDVLLHECVHQYCIETLGKPEPAEKGHGATFAAECTRIGAALGLPAVGPARASRRKPGLASCGQWPHNVRPSNYYLGAYAPNGVQIAPTIPVVPPGAPDPQVPQLEAEIQRLKLELAKVETERDQARADLAAATHGLPSPNGAAADALRTLLTAYGDDLLKNSRRLAGLLRDTCPGQPLEASLLVAATRFDLARLRLGGIFAAVERARLIAQLVQDQGIAPALADWTVEAWSSALTTAYAGSSVQST